MSETTDRPRSAGRPKPLGSLRRVADLRAHAQALGLVLGADDVIEAGAHAPLGRPYSMRDGTTIGNRFCIHPMEGWDGTEDGHPTALTTRRWRRFGASGAKLLWGCEAVAVRRDGRANPNQLLIDQDTTPDLERLRREAVATHEQQFGRSDDLVVGLQLTHSGRYARPDGRGPAPLVAQQHPVLDGRLASAPTFRMLSDDDLEALVEDFVAAAVLADQAGFHFVDVKHCHGYLGHEILGAHLRPGRFGGSLENRTRFLRLIVAGVRARAPRLRIGVRVSAFDIVPFAKGADGRGRPEAVALPYRHGFGVDPRSPTDIDLSEPTELLRMLRALDIELVNVTGGSPYYNPHAQRPALYPPSDGYDPPEDPLAGVVRQIEVTAALKRAVPDVFVVGSGWSYLQEWLPHVAQHVVRTGKADAVGLGRMVLSYPELPADVLAGKALDRQKICRTFSDCTSGPRTGHVSGCFPLDPFYRDRPEASVIKALRVRAGRPAVPNGTGED